MFSKTLKLFLKTWHLDAPVHLQNQVRHTNIYSQIHREDDLILG